MAFTLPNGSTIHIANATGTSINVTAVSNANPAVCTATAHGLANGDVVIFTSGWSKLTNRIFRVANVAANTFELEGVNTVDTNKYPAGSGTGSVVEVTGWTQLQQVLNTTTEGGQQNYATFQPLEADDEVRIPTNKTASGLNLEIGDDPTLAGYQLAYAANEDGDPRAVRVTNKNGAKSFYYSYISLNPTPSMNVNQVQTVAVSLSNLGRPVRYAS